MQTSQMALLLYWAAGLLRAIADLLDSYTTSIPGHTQSDSSSTAQIPSGSTSPAAAQPDGQMPSSSATPVSPSAAPTESMGEPSQDPDVFTTVRIIKLDRTDAIKSGSRYHKHRNCHSLINGAKTSICKVPESAAKKNGLTPCCSCW
jgi:hypothetical protein